MLKNDFWFTFGVIESDLRAVRSPRLFLRIDMNITKYLSTDSMSYRSIENILRASQDMSSFQSNSPFWDYGLTHSPQKESLTEVSTGLE